jgi:hypothetical protein
MPEENNDEVLSVDDFKFLTSKILKKLEIRFNEKSSDKLYAKAYFALPGSVKRDDTMLAVYLSGADMTAILKKLHAWYNGFYLATTTFSKLTSEAIDKVA